MSWEFPCGAVSYGSSVVTTVAWVTAVVCVPSLPQKLQVAFKKICMYINTYTQIHNTHTHTHTHTHTQSPNVWTLWRAIKTYMWPIWLKFTTSALKGIKKWVCLFHMSSLGLIFGWTSKNKRFINFALLVELTKKISYKLSRRKSSMKSDRYVTKSNNLRKVTY